MLSNYCETIRQKYGITIEQVQKLIPTLNNKEKYVLYYRNVQLYPGLGLKLTKILRALEFYQSPWLKTNSWIKIENSSLVVYFVGFIIKTPITAKLWSSFVFLTKQWNPCIIRIVNLKVDFREKSAHYTRVNTVVGGLTPNIGKNGLVPPIPLPLLARQCERGVVEKKLERQILSLLIIPISLSVITEL